MVVDWFIFENNQIRLITCFNFITKTMGVPKSGVIFYWVRHFEEDFLKIILYFKGQFTVWQKHFVRGLASYPTTA